MDKEERFQRDLKIQLEKWEKEINNKKELLTKCSPNTSKELNKEIKKLEKYISEGIARVKDSTPFYNDVVTDPKNNTASFWQRIKAVFVKRMGNNIDA